ncbi:hypothetical protein MNBD_CPR01-348 [hydrothermal vent metagenome]|uniref:Uncharacterized protein n=1 Tax=hydrothermal vent metagenome TaxID=652676 RepID=A0A3B0UMN9_9ZZZZ
MANFTVFIFGFAVIALVSNILFKLIQAQKELEMKKETLRIKKELEMCFVYMNEIVTKCSLDETLGLEIKSLEKTFNDTKDEIKENPDWNKVYVIMCIMRNIILNKTSSIIDELSKKPPLRS